MERNVSAYDEFENNLEALRRGVSYAPASEFPDMPSSVRKSHTLENIHRRSGCDLSATLDKLSHKPHNEDNLYYTMEPHIFRTILRYCDNRARRRAILRNHAKLGGQNSGSFNNIPVIERIINSRHALAQKFGYVDFLHYRFKDKMEKSPEKIIDTLAALAEKNTPAQIEHLAELSAFARSMEIDCLRPWDLYYVEKKYLKNSIPRTPGKFMHYFELEQFMPKFLAWVGDLFSVKFSADPGSLATGEVSYLLLDVSSQDPIARVFFDIFNKYSPHRQGSCASLTTYLAKCPPPGLTTSNIANSKITLNFRVDPNTRKCLLGYNDIINLAHEMGHVLEDAFAPRANHNSCRGELDMTEIASTFMENFMKTPELLYRLSAHYQTGAQIPWEKLNEIIEWHKRGAIIKNNVKVTRALLDLHVNEKPHISLFAKTRRVAQKTGLARFHYLNPCVDTHFFRHHEFNDYPGNLYTYTFSSTLAKKLYAPFAELSPPYPKGLCRDLRTEVFAQFGQRSFATSFREFTGKNLTY